jgi:hypothetical protein
MLESTVRKQASELAQFKKLMASGQLPQQDLIIPVPPPMTANEEDEEVRMHLMLHKREYSYAYYSRVMIGKRTRPFKD